MTGRLAAAMAILVTVTAAWLIEVATDPRCDGQSCVPGVGQRAVLGQPCSTGDRYIFSTSESGELLACVREGGPARWVRSTPLAGVRDKNSHCTPAVEGSAQAPDGVPLRCVAYPSDPSGSSGYWSKCPEAASSSAALSSAEARPGPLGGEEAVVLADIAPPASPSRLGVGRVNRQPHGIQGKSSLTRLVRPIIGRARTA